MAFDLKKFPQPEKLQDAFSRVTRQQVETVLGKSELQDQDLIALLSPAAGAYLEFMAQQAKALTQQRFGRIMKMYAPLYLSNECTNACLYCGFGHQQKISRRTLDLDETVKQARFLKARGFQNLLLVSGESRQHVPVALMRECLEALREDFPEISIEVYPLETAEYQSLVGAGLYGMAIYQETYLPDVYARMHPAGRKRDFDFRLETPERGAQAGIRQVGLGALLGLADFRLEAFYLGMHARFIQNQHWQTLAGISFPRLRQATGDFKPPAPVADAELVQMIIALRLFLPDAPFSLSTREPADLRKHLIHLGFTQISAGSCTAPGGYGAEDASGSQFSVEDSRTAAEIAAELVQAGFEPVWKDWDQGF